MIIFFIYFILFGFKIININRNLYFFVAFYFLLLNVQMHLKSYTDFGLHEKLEEPFSTNEHIFFGIFLTFDLMIYIILHRFFF